MFLYAFKFVRHSEANGRRTQKTVTPSGGSSTTTDYLSDGDHEVAEYAAGATTPSKRFIYGKNVDEIIAQHEPATNSYSYAHRNHQGSVIAVSKAGGLVASSDIYTYSPYGEPNITTGFPYRYTGRRLDTETGLYYYRARYYDAQLGRFLQTDPVGYEDQMNLYAYTGNDPVNKIDPDGHQTRPPLLPLPHDRKMNDEMSKLALKVIIKNSKPKSKLNQWANKTLKGIKKLESIKEALKDTQKKESTGGTNFVVTPNGTAVPIPPGAQGPTPVVNPSGNQTGVAYTGGSGGDNGAVSTVRIMDPVPARGNSPAYPSGYVKYENSASPKPQGVDPNTGRTLPNSESHISLE